jgi:hypothetical protein
MYNKKLLSKIDLGKFTKSDPYKKDIIYDPMGQWKYPGQNTRIPSGNITMKGLNKPLLGVASTGEKKMMQPGQEYNFPGANYVDEFPQAKEGMIVDLSPAQIEEYRKGGYIIEDLDAYDGGGDLPPKVGLSYLPKGERSYYDPIMDNINLDSNASEGELNHEMAHAWQNRQDGFRSDPYSPKLRPSTAASDEQAATYFNRKGDDVDRYLSNLNTIVPELGGHTWNKDIDTFIPDQIKYDKVIDPLMYSDPTTLEGEAEYMAQVYGRPPLEIRKHGGLHKFIDGGQPCPEGYEWVEAIGDCFKINPDANDILYPQTKTPVSAEYAAENPNVMPYVLNLPEAQAGLPDWMADNKKFGKDNINWYQAWNPKKWGLNDYSEYSSYNSAFRNARASKEKEFVYKGERYNTDLIPKKESDLYWESKNFLKDYYKNEPYKFNGEFDSDTPREYLIKESYVKDKYGTSWVELYYKIEATDPNDPKYIEMNELLEKIRTEELDIENKTNKDYANYQNSILTKAKQKAIDGRLASLDKPSYFSITNQKPKSMRADGYWNEKDNKTFMYTKGMPGKLNTTYVHELSHKGDDFLDVLNTVPQIDMEKFNKSPYIKTWDQKHFDYVSNPTEIEARKLSTLFYLFKNKKPYKSGKITQEILDDLYSNSEKLPYDIKQLLDLYGVQQEDLLKYLNSNYEYKKKKGVFLNQKQFGGPLNKFVEGGKPDNGIITQEEIDAANTAMMKARLAYANEFGNPAAKRMINIPDEPYQFDNGDMGTHYMASMDNYAVPQIQDENGQLMLGDYGPDSREAMRFDSDEDANYFAEHYKDVSPGFINEKKEGGASGCPKDHVWDSNTKKCVKVYTLANDQKLIDGVSNWAMHSSNPDKVSSEYNDQIKHYLYSGKYGYDPVSGTLYPLKKEQKTVADAETKKILAKQDDKAAYTQSIIDAGFDPDTFGKSKGTNVITGEEIYGDKSQEDVDKINKEAVNDFVTEGHKQAILESPFNVAAFFTPPGMAAGVMQGAANFLPDVYNFGKDPSWSTAGAVGMDALMMSPAARGIGKFLGYVPKKLPGSPNVISSVDDAVSSADDVVTQLRNELSKEGIISQQKTLNLPWKEPIRKTVKPWNYDVKEKMADIKTLFKDSKNPDYFDIDKAYEEYVAYQKSQGVQNFSTKEAYTEKIKKGLDETRFMESQRDVLNHRFDNRFSEKKGASPSYGFSSDVDANIDLVKNRWATWDMYLGKPQTKHPMYDISELTKSKKDVVYTIKENFIGKEEVGYRLNDYISEIEGLKNGASRGIGERGAGEASSITKKGDSWIVPDTDTGMFGTMGGFHWKIEKMLDGNYKAIANDVWDLQPLKNKKIGNPKTISGKILNKVTKPIKNIEVGKALGIGKPLNVKVGFIIDGKTKKIINTFGLAPLIGAGVALGTTQNKYGGLHKFVEEGMILDLSPKEIEGYKNGGYIVEELSDYAEGGVSKQKIIFSSKGGDCLKDEYWNGTKCVKIPKNTRIVYHTDKDVYDKAFAAESDSSHFYNNAKSDYNKVRALQSRIRTSVGDAAQDKARDAYNKERDRQEKKWYTDNYEPGTTINHKYKGPKSNLKIKPVGLTKDSIDGYGFPVFKKPVVHNVYEEPIEEEFIPMPIKKPELIDTTTGDIIGQSEQLLAPEYSARYPENRIGYKKYNWNTTKSGLPKRQPNTGGFYKKANKKVEDIQNYMEGYEDEDGNYIPGEIEKAEQEGRQIKFKGNVSKTDKKAQETYNKEYDEYENLKNYQNGMMNLMQYKLNKKQYGGLHKFVGGGMPDPGDVTCPDGYEINPITGRCVLIKGEPGFIKNDVGEWVQDVAGKIVVEDENDERYKDYLIRKHLSDISKIRDFGTRESILSDFIQNTNDPTIPASIYETYYDPETGYDFTRKGTEDDIEDETNKGRYGSRVQLFNNLTENQLNETAAQQLLNDQGFPIEDHLYVNDYKKNVLANYIPDSYLARASLYSLGSGAFATASDYRYTTPITPVVEDKINRDRIKELYPDITDKDINDEFQFDANNYVSNDLIPNTPYHMRDALLDSKNRKKTIMSNQNDNAFKDFVNSTKNTDEMFTRNNHVYYKPEYIEDFTGTDLHIVPNYSEPIDKYIVKKTVDNIDPSVELYTNPDAPEYSPSYPENRIEYNKYNWNSGKNVGMGTKWTLPKRKKDSGGFYNKMSKKVQDIKNYMEGYEDEDGNYIPGEIENAEREGRQLQFKGNSSKADKKAQEEYIQDWTQYQIDKEAIKKQNIDLLEKYGLSTEEYLKNYKKQGGSISKYNINTEHDLTDAEVARLKKLGYKLEKL